jgi:hypothetical protein
MKIFHFVADARFEAEDIDDALTKLALHFKDVRDGRESTLDQIGSIGINAYITEEPEKNE